MEQHEETEGSRLHRDQGNVRVHHAHPFSIWKVKSSRASRAFPAAAAGRGFEGFALKTKKPLKFNVVLGSKSQVQQKQNQA